MSKKFNVAVVGATAAAVNGAGAARRGAIGAGGRRGVAVATGGAPPPVEATGRAAAGAHAEQYAGVHLEQPLHRLAGSRRRYRSRGTGRVGWRLNPVDQPRSRWR